MVKVLLILLASTVSILAQINLKATSPRLPLSFPALQQLGYASFAVLILRAGLFSGASLLVTWVAYKRFGFLELIVAQSVVFVFAVAASYLVFQEPVTMNKIASVAFILVGIGLFYR
ncbi:hypothetical protein WDW86_03165 [Bdellovibrionota bacterium FG-2]